LEDGGVGCLLSMEIPNEVDFDAYLLEIVLIESNHLSYLTKAKESLRKTLSIILIFANLVDIAKSFNFHELSETLQQFFRLCPRDVIVK
jgi:hypothetical protein